MVAFDASIRWPRSRSPVLLCPTPPAGDRAGLADHLDGLLVCGGAAQDMAAELSDAVERLLDLVSAPAPKSDEP
jgi:hypothetical protein